MVTRRDFIKKTSLAGVGFLIGCRVRSRFDLILKNGTVVDGTGKQGFPADVGIKGDKIKAIGDLSSSSADKFLDVKGSIVSPGFIDIHTHTDTELIVNPTADSKICQGITTEVSGNCGSSPFPYNDSDFATQAKNLKEKYGIELDWHDTAGFLNRLETQGIAFNYVTLTGHGDIRACVVGKNDVPASPEQIAQMRSLIRQSMEQGSFGLSTGLEYAPGSYASTEELIELCKEVAALGGLYATHMRNEDDTVEEALQEALRISREAQVRLQISHLKTCNKNNWHKVDHLLQMLHSAREEGLPLYADRYPYIAYGTGLTAFLPLSARQGSTEEVIERLSHPEKHPEIKEYTESRGKRIGGWDRVVISSCFSEKNKIFEGKSILAAAEETGKSPFEFIRTILIEEKNRVSIVGFAMNEDNLNKVLADPLVMCASDGSAVSPQGKLGAGKPHPRYYGTFPRFLGKYVRQERICSLENAIKKITGMPAEQLKLKNRGLIKEGYFADLTIFDFNTIIDNATFTNPHRFPTGINYVIVNGKIAVVQGKVNGALPGRVLRFST